MSEPTNSTNEPRWRCEYKYAADKNLISKFFRAPNAQAAMELAQTWFGSNSAVTVQQDPD